jgi:hypothetical protein
MLEIEFEEEPNLVKVGLITLVLIICVPLLLFGGIVAVIVYVMAYIIFFIKKLCEVIRQ